MLWKNLMNFHIYSIYRFLIKCKLFARKSISCKLWDTHVRITHCFTFKLHLNHQLQSDTVDTVQSLWVKQPFFLSRQMACDWLQITLWQCNEGTTRSWDRDHEKNPWEDTNTWAHFTQRHLRPPTVWGDRLLMDAGRESRVLWFECVISLLFTIVSQCCYCSDIKIHKCFGFHSVGSDGDGCWQRTVILQMEIQFTKCFLDLISISSLSYTVWKSDLIKNSAAAAAAAASPPEIWPARQTQDKHERESNQTPIFNHTVLFTPAGLSTTFK